ncbi:hypothetical protein N4P33_19575 [Streptomyces sp. 15-116A]|uniref:hypothetical protein n=1 Tax=Streptomyces sp. 15-116A TaxID=2259035 RepID=UPI0021B26E82|nr:hypothetical protein [Streptomyces sp. 15-116A]MCT7354335.1 hypothetical protein [Streptomyces sp. 15-116A]
MSGRQIVLDPVIPRFCAQTGASLPLAWELAWSERPHEAVIRLTPPPDPPLLDRATWCRRLPAGTRLTLSSGVRRQNTPMPFLHDGGPVAVLFGTHPPAFVEVPEPVGDVLAQGATVAAIRRRWTQPDDVTDRLLVGMMRCGLLRGDPSPLLRQEPEGDDLLVQEAWVEVVEWEPGVHVLAHTATGTFLKVGAAALQLWRRAGNEDGIAFHRLPSRLHGVAERLLSSGMLRAVRAERPGGPGQTPAAVVKEEPTREDGPCTIRPTRR